MKGRIDRLHGLRMRGAEEYVLVRGGADSPLLLFLHDGPGRARISFAAAFQKDLERSFLVAQWDQCGAGKSYEARDGLEEGGIRAYLGDIALIAAHLMKTYGKHSFLLAGLGWGAALALLYASEPPSGGPRPAGIAISGLSPSLRRSEPESLKLLGKRAKEMSVEGFDPATWERALASGGFAEFASYSKYAEWKAWWANRLGAGERGLGPLATFRALPQLALRSQYSFDDYANLRKGAKLGLKVAAKELPGLDLFERVPSVGVPVLFVHGGQDLLSPPACAREYFEALSAPRKEWAEIARARKDPSTDRPRDYAAALGGFFLS
jgi:proline iminopeptidase